jgi:hypothetical protein
MYFHDTNLFGVLLDEFVKVRRYKYREIHGANPKE